MYLEKRKLGSQARQVYKAGREAKAVYHKYLQATAGSKDW